MTPPVDYFDGPEKRAIDRRIPITPHPHTAYEECPGGCKDLDLVNDTIGKTKVELNVLGAQLQVYRDQLLRFETRLDESNARAGRIETLIADNSTTMGRNTSDTAEILGIMRETQSAFRLIEKSGNVLKWFFGIAAPLVAIYLAIKGYGK